MIVVADASPINYLIQLEWVEILEQLYRRVHRWRSTLPSWAEVGHLVASRDDSLRDFGAGEREAILLALQEHADCCSWMRDEENSRQSRWSDGTANTAALLETPREFKEVNQSPCAGGERGPCPVFGMRELQSTFRRRYKHHEYALRQLQNDSTILRTAAAVRRLRVGARGFFTRQILVRVSGPNSCPEKRSYKYRP